MNTSANYTVIGLMSGSSLDGLDLVCCRFELSDNTWNFTIESSECVDYPEEVVKYLTDAFYKTPEEIKQTDINYGKFLGQKLKSFIQKNGLKPDFIASHGHTIFHRPQEKYTLQIGDGQVIANETGLTVINDFRSADVMKGGQGAPLVPVGDRLLFSEYPICLNIGGIANLSFEHKGERIAFDICIANQALNYLANREGKNYDAGGEMARTGILNEALFNTLNTLDYYNKPFPKSLGREFFEKTILPMLLQSELNTMDLLRTMVDHIAFQIAKSTGYLPVSTILVTGGGAFNSFLIEQLSSQSKHHISIPDSLTINFKEAIIFAFLGVLRYRNEINCYKSVTGAFEDSCTGLIHYPKDLIRGGNF
jgi:anhydro-N-acetylmuramic acid kinase